MTTRNYDPDTFSFSLSSLILTTPVSLARLYYYLSSYSFVPFLSLPLCFYHSFAHTSWTMTHSDISSCTTSLFSYFLVPSIWLIVTHLRTLIYYKLWPLYYKYHLSICSRPQLCLRLTLTIHWLPWTPLILCLYLVIETLSEPLNHWTHRYLVLMSSSVSLSGHNKVWNCNSDKLHQENIPFTFFYFSVLFGTF